MPGQSITKKTEKLLILKSQSTGLPKSQIVELAVINFTLIDTRALARLKNRGGQR